MPTRKLLTPRRWQTQLQKGVLKRNSPGVKTAVWILQWRRLRELREEEYKRLRYQAVMTTGKAGSMGKAPGRGYLVKQLPAL